MLEEIYFFTFYKSASLKYEHILFSMFSRYSFISPSAFFHLFLFQFLFYFLIIVIRIFHNSLTNSFLIKSWLNWGLNDWLTGFSLNWAQLNSTQLN